MKYTLISRCLKGILILITVIGFIFYAGMVPETIRGMAINFPEFNYLVIPSIIIIQLSAIPVIIVLLTTWSICTNVSKNQLFNLKNAKNLLIIGYSSMVDTIYCFSFSIFLYIVRAFNPGVFLISVSTIVIGLTVTLISFLLALLTKEAILMNKEIMKQRQSIIL